MPKTESLTKIFLADEAETTALANNPRLAGEAIMNRLDGAVFEFAFDPALRETSTGVRITQQSPEGGAQ